jgi:RNA polymerase sigma-70 factor (ECF subfamily)
MAVLERRLIARIRRMMGPEAREGVESGDVLQSVYADTLVQLGPDALQAERHLPWMTEVARNKIVDVVRRRRQDPLRERAAEASELLERSPASEVVEAEDEQRLLEALARLDPERRQVVALRCEEGSAWSEVAVAVGRSEEAARKLYHRALLQLGQALVPRGLGT